VPSGQGFVIDRPTTVYCDMIFLFSYPPHFGSLLVSHRESPLQHYFAFFYLLCFVSAPSLMHMKYYHCFSSDSLFGILMATYLGQKTKNASFPAISTSAIHLEIISLGSTTFTIHLLGPTRGIQPPKAWNMVHRKWFRLRTLQQFFLECAPTPICWHKLFESNGMRETI
jgi:hypothetical protein